MLYSKSFLKERKQIRTIKNFNNKKGHLKVAFLKFFSNENYIL